MAKSWIKVRNSVETKPFVNAGHPNVALAFEDCRYIYDNGTFDDGYRFIWKIDGKRMAHRGQARLPSKKVIQELLDQAEKQGWLN